MTSGRRDSVWIDRVVEGFENVSLGRRGEELERFVARLREESKEDPGALREAIARLVEVALEARWKLWAAGEDGSSRPPTLGEYAADLPELGGPDLWPGSLIAQDYFLRLLYGGRPDRRALLDQYPGRADELREEFDRAEADAARAVPEIRGYRDLVPIGNGGMGVVYRGVQESLRRVVAIKVLDPDSFKSPSTLRRFRLEAEALAELQHPNVVAVYDYGATDRGPYLALEYVRGGSLRGWLDALPEGDRRLPPRLAAALVRDLAGAAHRAHQEEIIHRDLKPGNVLLAPPAGVPLREATLESCVPKLTDFGLVKRLDAPADETKTQHGRLLGTPAYMAPEQARGEHHVARAETDVYGLGAILYELLAGRPPFVGPNVAVILRRIVDEEPAPVRSLRAEVDRDLETITLKCLAKEMSGRYRSARELAADLDQYLDHRPVLARPVGKLERAVRWCRRNPPVARLLGTAAAAVLLALAVSALISAASARKASASARLTYQTLDDVVGRLATDERLMRRGLGDLQAELLGQALPRLESIRRSEAGADADLLKGQALLHMVDIYRVRGQAGDALRTLEEAEKVFAALGVAGRPEPEPRVRYGIAVARAARGVFLGRSRERVDEGLILLDDAAARFNALRVEGWGDPVDLRRRAAMCWYSRGDCLRFRDPALASAAYRRALAEFQALADGAETDGESRTWLVRTRSNLGLECECLGRCAEAVREHGEAVRLARELVEKARTARREPTLAGRESWLLFDLDYREALGGSLRHLGELLGRLGRPGESVSAFREALEIDEGLADAVPSYREYARNVAMSRTDLAWALSASGPAHWEEADDLFRRAEGWYAGEQLRLGAQGTEDPELKLAREINRLHASELATRRFLQGGGPPGPALGALREACDGLRACGDGPEPRRRLGEALVRLGDALDRVGDPDGATDARSRAQEVLAGLAADWPLIPGVGLMLADVEARIAASLSRSGRPEEAERMARRARLRLDAARASGIDDPLVARVDAELAAAPSPPDR